MKYTDKAGASKALLSDCETRSMLTPSKLRSCETMSRFIHFSGN
jgi:hypothetical protein